MFFFGELPRNKLHVGNPAYPALGLSHPVDFFVATRRIIQLSNPGDRKSPTGLGYPVIQHL